MSENYNEELGTIIELLNQQIDLLEEIRIQLPFVPGKDDIYCPPDKYKEDIPSSEEIYIGKVFENLEKCVKYEN